MTSVASVLDIAAKQLGTKESPANSNHTKYGVWYGLDRNPWCAMFVSWVLHQAGFKLVVQTSKGFAWTPAGVAWGKQNGRWIEPSALQPGDLIFFNFDNDAGPEHVGFVERVVAPGHYQTIEGNTGVGNDANGGEVMRRDRKGTIILGGVRLPLTSKAKVPTKPAVPKGDGFRHPTLGIGAGTDKKFNGQGSPEVKHMQALLHRHGAVIVMDGMFGPATEKKLRAFQNVRFGRRGTDGVCGPQTWAALHS